MGVLVTWMSEAQIAGVILRNSTVPAANTRKVEAPDRAEVGLHAVKRAPSLPTSLTQVLFVRCATRGNSVRTV